MSKKKKKIIWGSVILFVIMVFIVIGMIKNRNGQAITVQTAEVGRQKIVEKVTATGRIEPKTQVKVSADVAAKIIRMGVTEGDQVKAGDFLVQLDRERFMASVESAEANLRSVEATALLNKENMIKAQKDYQRAKKLFEKQLESQAALDQMYATAKVAEARYQSTREQVAQAKAALKRTQDDLSKTTIYTPIAGTISKLNKEVGEIALGSQFQEDVIMVISDLSRMEAQINVDENDIVAISLTDRAEIEVDALPDKVYDGVVTEIANSATITGSGTASQKTEFEVKISIVNPDQQLRPGMTASSDIITEIRDNTIGVPIQCVALKTAAQLKGQPPEPKGSVALADSFRRPTYQEDEDGFVQVVFLVEKDWVIARQVETGIQSENHIEILQGIEPGDEIVTGNYRAISEQLKNYTHVTIDNAKPAG